MSMLPYMYGILVMYEIPTIKRMLDTASIPRSPKARDLGHPRRGFHRWAFSLPHSAERGGDCRIKIACAHQHQRTLGKGRIDEQRGAGQRQAEVDVVQEQKGRERPEQIEGEQKRPYFEDFVARSGRMEEYLSLIHI